MISLIKAKTYPNVTADVNTYAVLLFIDSSITNFHSLITRIKSKIGQTHSQFTNVLPNDRLEGIIKTMIKDLEKRKDKAMIRSDTDDLWIKIETLQWVLFVIFAYSSRLIVYKFL